MTLKEKINQEAIKYAEFNKFTSDRAFEFNRDKIAFTNGAYIYFDNLADDYAIEFAEWLNSDETEDLIEDLKFVGELSQVPKTKELLEIFKKEKGYDTF
jgi:hypothetical protein